MDPSSVDNWVGPEEFPLVEGREQALHFTVGQNIYFGMGCALCTSSSSIPFNDWWQYDIETAALDSIAPFPGTVRIEALSFTINDIGFVGLGRNVKSGEYFQDFWKYDPNLDTWEEVAPFPDNGRSAAVAFAIGEKAYVCTGSEQGNVNFPNTLWEYDFSQDQWIQKLNLPPGFTERKEAVGLSLSGKGYVITGRLKDGDIHSNEIWEYIPQN